MKRSNSAPSLAENDRDARPKRIRAGKDEAEGPNTREYMQLALAKVLELQRALNDDTYFDDQTSDLGESDNDDDLMRHVLTRVFRDLPGTTSEKINGIIERGASARRELSKIRGKSIQLSGYDTCRRVAVDFMKKTVQAAERGYRLPVKRGSRLIDETEQASDRKISNQNSNYELRMRMLMSLDLHLAAKQRDYTAMLMRH